MLFKAIMYYIFTPLLIAVSLFCIHMIVTLAKIIGSNFKKATNIFKNTIAPRSYKPLHEYNGEYDNVEKYFAEKGVGVYLTSNFLLIKTKNSFDILPKTSVIWLYYKEENSKLKYQHTNINMLSEIDNYIVICTELGKRYQIMLSQFSSGIVNGCYLLRNGNSIDEIVNALPTAVFGYSKELERLYKNNPRTFLEKVK